MDALYGPQGKLSAFVNDWLKPFITEKERLPVKVDGVAIPLSAAYQGMVAAERNFSRCWGMWHRSRPAVSR